MATVMPTPTAHLQIKYVTHLARASETRLRHQRALSSPNLTSTITELPTSWRISTIVRNLTPTIRSQSIQIFSWPMFEPESRKLVATASTGTIPPMASGKADIEVTMRSLAVRNSKGNFELEEGIYMFEIKNAEDLATGSGVVKQVSVVGGKEWDE